MTSVRTSEHGYAMAALLVAMAIMAIVMTAAMPVWNTQARREREEEYIFRAKQYGRAVALFQRKYANAFPPNVDVLLNEKFLRKKYKDPITNDDFDLVRVGSPLANNIPGAPVNPRAGGPGQQQPGTTTPGGLGGASPTSRMQQLQEQSAFGQARIGQAGGGGGIMGVVSKSKEKSLRLLNGRDTYNQWVVLGTDATLFAGRGGVGSQTPGGAGANRPGMPNSPRGGGPGGQSRPGFPTPGGSSPGGTSPFGGRR